MKKLIMLICCLLLVNGCAGKKPHAEVLAVKTFKETGCHIIDIPSHGLLGDGLALSVGGGAYVTNVRSTLLEIQKNETMKQVLFTSTNSLLAKMILSNALDDLESDSLDTLHLVFAGKPSHGEDLRPTVEATGARYETVVR